jgi:Kef-type K+ transport system membrane component KefB
VVERLGQPAVLGELLFGILLGNLALLGGPSLAALEASETFAILAELGAILLLFEVGLESTPKDMMAVGIPATIVALVGVVAPMALGYGVGRVMLPDESWMAHAFVGAMLAATSVGITARVLQGAKAIKTPSARIILGAAVIDDVLGLVVLAIIAGVIKAAAAGTTLDAMGIAAIMVKAFAVLFSHDRHRPTSPRASSATPSPSGRPGSCRPSP